MKNTFLIIAVLAGSLYVGTQFIAPQLVGCARPIVYSVGGFDNRFGITEEEFLALIQDAENVWESAAESDDLFKYDPDGNFDINLVFDERQKRTIVSEEVEEELDEKQAEFEAVDSEFQALQNEYRQAQAAFEADSSAYHSELAVYNERVEAWNDSNRRNEGEFEELEAKRQELEVQGDALAEREAELAALFDELQATLEERNEVAARYNINVEDYNERFGGVVSFDQGNYTGEEINIYQFETKDDLRLVLTHELGHALGIDHVDDPEAVMYYLLEEQNPDTVTLTEADMQALTSQCSL